MPFAMATADLQLGCGASGIPYRMRRWKIGHGDSAIYKTILHMQSLVFGPEGVGHPNVRIAALEAVRGAIKNVNEIDHVLAWVKRTIEFRGENAETLQSPVVTLQLGAGDCDDHSMLIAALLLSLGYKVRFRTVAASAGAPAQFSHVYAVVQDKRTGQWLPLDSTVAGSFPGWEPPMIYRQKTYRLKGLGDEIAYQPLVPITPAPSDLGPKGQFAYDLTAPFAQALASRIAHGPTPAVTGNLNLGLSGSGGLPSWVWLLGAAGVVFLIYKTAK